jgi:hypothetical protein
MQTRGSLVEDEDKRIRHLRIAADLVEQILMTHPVTLAEAERLIDGVRTLARKLFPGKDHVFDLIYVPRFRRAIREAGLFNGVPVLRIVNGRGR